MTFRLKSEWYKKEKMACKEKGCGDEFKCIYCQVAIPCTEDCQPAEPYFALHEGKMSAFDAGQNTAWPTEISWEREACIPPAVLIWEPLGTNASWESCPKAVPRPAAQER